jgi:hypothetical protein
VPCCKQAWVQTLGSVCTPSGPKGENELKTLSSTRLPAQIQECWSSVGALHRLPLASHSHLAANSLSALVHTHSLTSTCSTPRASKRTRVVGQRAREVLQRRAHGARELVALPAVEVVLGGERVLLDRLAQRVHRLAPLALRAIHQPLPEPGDLEGSIGRARSMLLTSEGSACGTSHCTGGTGTRDW